jgi:epoxyqueuosine reductase
MTAEDLTVQLYAALEEKGYRGRTVPIHRLAGLKEEIDTRYSEGALDAVFYQERLGHFASTFPSSFPDTGSILITSAPQPQQRVDFHLWGKAYHVTIPPTYSAGTDAELGNILAAVLEFRGHKFQAVSVPLKLLAVRSGMARYGKNNITYVEGMGSFQRLQAFLLDITAPEDMWQEVQVLEECATCSACANRCPTGAITPERFLIRAERCLTFHNESEAEFPDWVNSSWHNCLVGCMHCQVVCPVNKQFVDWSEDTESFTEGETELILKGCPAHEVPADAAQKLERLDLLEDLGLVARNLKVLIEQQPS